MTHRTRSICTSRLTAGRFPYCAQIIGGDDSTPELLNDLAEIDVAIATELLDRLQPRDD